eukprot:TRINITY_DN49465_c0_g1_i1.p1 TRINITY_DN49465_c0_g1~~TRINITY_DN49465_c0_g1_i1.p1  ORF type:complete len:223 (-),score=13.98 TRINITY_DN49465_c0_g1_i1:572-1240(-)
MLQALSKQVVGSVNYSFYNFVRCYTPNRKRWPPLAHHKYKQKAKKLWPPKLTLRQQAIKDLIASRIARTIYEYERPITTADLFARLKERGTIEHKETLDQLLLYLESRKWIRKSKDLELEGKTKGRTHEFYNYHYMMTFRGKFIMYLCKKQAPYFPHRQNALLPTRYLDFEKVEEPQSILEDVSKEQQQQDSKEIKLIGRESRFYKVWKGKQGRRWGKERNF